MNTIFSEIRPPSSSMNSRFSSKSSVQHHRHNGATGLFVCLPRHVDESNDDQELPRPIPLWTNKNQLIASTDTQKTKQTVAILVQMCTELTCFVVFWVSVVVRVYG